MTFFSYFKKYAPIALLSLNLASCYKPRLLSEQRPDYTNQELAIFRRSWLELETRIEGTVNANVYTTFDSRALMENKAELMKNLIPRFKNSLEYFNSFCDHPVNEINIVIDSSTDSMAAFGYVPFFTRIMVLDESMLELSQLRLLRHIADMTIIHEYSHIQLNAQDEDEPTTYKELSAILVESLNAIRLYGYDWYKEKYINYFDPLPFHPDDIFEDESSYYALRLIARQLTTDAFEGNITSEDNERPLRMLEHFARNYFKEEANGTEGFNLAADDSGLIFNDRALELEDVRQRAYNYFIDLSQSNTSFDNGLPMNISVP